MAHAKDTVFSDYFLNQLGIKFQDDDAATLIDCVGELEEEMETKTITKSCRGRVKKSRTKGSQGTVTITCHMPIDVYRQLYGMEEFAEGVFGYGTTSMHAVCTITAEVLDEDDNVKYLAYPVAVCNTRSATIDDDADEVAMVELEFTVTADDNEMIVYDGLAVDISEDIASQWMSNFTPDLIAASAAKPTSAKVEKA